MKIFNVLTAVAVLGTAMLINTEAYAGNHGNRMKGRGTGPIVYVTSQGLFYDSIVLTDLPNKGKFQKLEMTGPTGLQTEFGPGDVGHYGGRWWVDSQEEGDEGYGVMDDEDAYFLCPLLGPGRETP